MACHTGTIFNPTSMKIVSSKIAQCDITFTLPDLVFALLKHLRIAQIYGHAKPSLFTKSDNCT